MAKRRNRCAEVGPHPRSLPGYRAREEERVPRRARRVSRRAVVVVRAVGCREYSVVRDERGCNFAPPEAFSYTVMKDAGR